MITVEFNDAEANAVLAKIAAKLTDLTDLMSDIGGPMQDSTRQRFKDGKDPDGNAWAPRSPTTIAHYEKTKQRFGPILHKSRELANSINYQFDSRSVTVGTKVIYSAVMQFGASQYSLGPVSPWGNIPARPFIGLSEVDRTNVIETVQEWLADLA